MVDVSEVPVTDVPLDAVLVDVREDDEWQAGHAPYAIHIPLGQLSERAAEIPDGPVYVVCRAGARSANAAAWLIDNDRVAINVGGGMAAWASSGREMVAEDGSPARVI